MRRALLQCGRAVSSPGLARGLARWRAAPWTAAAALPPPPHDPSLHQQPLLHAASARGAWQRGSQRQRLPPGALSLIAERQRSSSSGSNTGGDGGTAAGASSSSQQGVLASPTYQGALRASLSRTTLSAEQLLEAAASQSASPKRQSLDAYSDMQPLLAAAMAALAGPALDEMLQGWTAASAERPPGFDSQAALALPGLAGDQQREAAVVSRGGRMSGKWKSENQDAFLLEAVGSTAGSAGTAGTAAGQQGSLLLGVLDGHGVGGQTASRLAAEGIAAELAKQLGSGSSSSSDGDGSSDSGSLGNGCSSSGGGGNCSPSEQQALVEAFQRVAARMQADAAFQEGGAAAVVCLVQPGSIHCAWAGDSRAVAGLSLEGPGGPTFVVHPLTQDHKPDSPQELARVVASGQGRVVRFSPGAPPRLCGLGNPNTLALSRAFGDNWALPMGLTAEPDAVTVTLPPPAPRALAPTLDGNLRSPLGSQGGIDSLSTDAEEEGAGGDGAGGGGSGGGSSGGSGGGSGGGSSGGSGGGSSNSSDGSAQAAPARHVLVVACDGLWDYVTNQESIEIALRHSSAEAAAHALADTARRRWAAAHSGEFMDDVTVAVCFLE